MTEFVTVAALHTVHHNPTGNAVEVQKPGGKPFKMKKSDFDELEPMGAVRKASKRDMVDDGDVDDDEQTSVSTSLAGPASNPAAAGGTTIPGPDDGLTLEHKGNGKYVVLNGAEVVSGDDLIQGKDAAQKFLDDYRAKAKAEPDLLG